MLKVSSPVLSYEKVLPFRGIKQKKENWCFAAATAAVHNFYAPGEPMTQEEVVELMFGKIIDKTGSARLTLNALGHLAKIEDRMVNWGEIQEEIDDGRPIVLSSGKHVIVLFGFKVTTHDAEDLLYFYDSEEDHPRALKFAAFLQEYTIEYSYKTRKA